MRLNDALIASEKYRGEPTTDDEGRQQWPVCILWDDDLQGFGVRIFPSQRGRPSRKDFFVTWKVGLRSRTMAIGTFPECSLRQARKMAREALDLARRGQDPIEARQRALGIGTAEDLASRFLFEHKAAQKKPVAGAGDTAGGPGALPGAAPESVPGVAAPAPEAPIGGETAASVSAADDAGAPSAASEPEIEASPSSTVEATVPEPTPEPEAAPLAASSEVPTPTSPPPVLEAPPVAEASAPAEPGLEPDVDGAVATAPPRIAAQAPQLPRPQVAPPQSPVKRGPTKVRLLPVPESLYRVIENGARESSMTIAAYLNALIEIARAAAGETPSRPPAGSAAGTPSDDAGPSIRELFARVQEAQAVEVGGGDEGGEPD